MRYLAKGKTYQLSTLLLLAIVVLALLAAYGVTSGGTSAAAAISSDKISFTSERDGNHEIYVMNADGSLQVNLTNHPSRDVMPVYSPDGTRIAFASNRNNNTPDLFVMKADGGSPLRVTRSSEFCCTQALDPAWSPDAEKIVYVSSFMGELSHLALIDADGEGQPTRVDDVSSEALDPAWSPDGTRIAFVARQPGEPFELEAFEFHLYAINADGSGRTRITDVPVLGRNSTGSTRVLSSLSGPTWSPDGTRLAFASHREGNWEIYVVGASGGAPTRLTANPAEDTFPVWSPDGTRIAFTSDRDGNREIYVMNADGTDQTRITNNAAPDYDPDWQSVEPRDAPPPAPATLQFSAAIYRTPEKGSQSTPAGATITVTRLGDMSGEASVDYKTRDLCDDTPGSSACIRTASERSDYIPAAGTLRFASGETSKSFSVLLVDDLSAEGDEILGLELGGAAGASLGGQSKATLIILDDEATPPGANPIDDRAFFVRQHYLDFLNREPDAAGLAFWADELNRCGSDARCVEERRVNVSAAFFLSIEFQNTGYLLHRFHTASFPNSLPRYQTFLTDLQRISSGVVVGAPGWEAQLEANKQAFATEWVQRPAFTAQLPTTLTAEQFVDALFASSGVTAPTPEERQAAIAAYGAGGTDGRARALRNVSDSGSVYNRQYNPAFVLIQYFGYLRRDPDQAGYNFWLGKMNDNSSPGEDVRDEQVALRRVGRAEMVKAFLDSTEYRRRFSQP